MKVKFTKLSEDCVSIDALTIGNVYECEKVSVFGSAYIKDDNGEESLLMHGEFEVVEK